jgi:hypothetical protein
LANAGHLTYMTSSTRLQQDAINRLVVAIDILQQFKRTAQREADCEKADYWLAMQCFSHALCHVLEMWLLLKTDKPFEAWRHKIDAEDYLKVALRALAQLGGVLQDRHERAFSELHERLIRLDHAVFPLMKFCSAGLTYSSARCSVCHEDISMCEHIEGYIYCGRVCSMVNLEDVVMNHVALVENPKDRRCVLTSIPWDDVERDSMTHEVVRQQESADGKTFGAIMIGRHTNLPDLCA